MKVIAFDMDMVLCDFIKEYKKNIDNLEYPQSKVGFFTKLEPLKDQENMYNYEYIAKFQELGYRVIIITAPSIKNNHCWSEKVEWVEKYLGEDFKKNIVITYDKSLLSESVDYLIDDSTKNGQTEFKGFLHYGKDFKDMKEIKDYIIKNDENNK